MGGSGQVADVEPHVLELQVRPHEDERLALGEALEELLPLGDLGEGISGLLLGGEMVLLGALGEGVLQRGGFFAVGGAGVLQGALVFAFEYQPDDEDGKQGGGEGGK